MRDCFMYLAVQEIDHDDVQLSAVRPMVTHCKLPFALCPGLCQESESAPRKFQRKDKRKKPPPNPTPSAEAMKEGVGRNSGYSSPPAPSSSASALLSSSCFHSDISLCMSSSAGVGTSLPASVVERKSKIGWLQCSSAKRSRILNRPLPLPVSLPTAAHRILLTFPVRTELEEMLPRLSPVRASPAFSSGLLLRPREVPTSEAVARLRLVEPRSEPFVSVCGTRIWLLTRFPESAVPIFLCGNPGFCPHLCLLPLGLCDRAFWACQ